MSVLSAVLDLPPQFANTSRFRLEELSRYDDPGPAWYSNDIHTGEHTGTHLDAPVHWVSGKDGLDVSQVPLSTLVAAAAVIDRTAQVEKDADFLLEIAHVQAWEPEHGAAARRRLAAAASASPAGSPPTSRPR